MEGEPAPQAEPAFQAQPPFRSEHQMRINLPGQVHTKPIPKPLGRNPPKNNLSDS